MKTICFVGMTNKEGKRPFDSTTKSGAIIDQMIKKLPFHVIKMNYVSFVPKTNFGKLRYPTKEELNHSFFDFLKKIKQVNPDLIVVCGKMIEKELKQKNFKECPYISIYHPSYIWVYKRSQLNFYIDDVVKKINLYLN